VTVHYVDYDNEDDVAISNLRAPLDHELFLLPPQVKNNHLLI